MKSLDPSALWLIAGITLVIGEMISASFFLLFIALGAFAAALASALGTSYLTQGVVCAVVAVLGVLILRKPIQQRLLKSVNISADIGKEIKIDQALAPHKQARITYQGTSWAAINLSVEALKEGDRVQIVGIDGNTLLIKKVH